MASLGSPAQMKIGHLYLVKYKNPRGYIPFNEYLVQCVPIPIGSRAIHNHWVKVITRNGQPSKEEGVISSADSIEEVTDLTNNDLSFLLKQESN